MPRYSSTSRANPARRHNSRFHSRYITHSDHDRFINFDAEQPKWENLLGGVSEIFFAEIVTSNLINPMDSAGYVQC